MLNFHLTYLSLSGVLISATLGLMSSQLIQFWFCLELNLLSISALFLSLIEKGNLSAIKYFVVQAFSSTLFLSSYLLFKTHQELFQSMVVLSMALKLGAAPLHNWFIFISEEISWQLFFWLATFQKILPLFMLLSLFNWSGLFYVILSALLPAFSSIGMTWNKSILAYGTVYSSAWLLSSFSYWMSAFIYLGAFTLALFLVSKTFSALDWRQLSTSGLSSEKANLVLWTSLLSLGGMPPLAGFFAKIGVLSNLSDSHQQLMVILSLTGVFYLFLYLQLTLYYFVLSYRPLLTKTTQASPSLLPFIALLLLPYLL